MKRLVMICMALLVIVGCVTTIDPITGEKLYQIDPNAVSAIEPLVETGITVAGVLGGLFPVILPFVTLAGGIYGTWKKIKPQVTKAQTEADLYHTTVASLVQAIEDYKEADPEGWLKLKEKIKIGNNVENVIRALRGKPPLE